MATCWILPLYCTYRKMHIHTMHFHILESLHTYDSDSTNSGWWQWPESRKEERGNCCYLWSVTLGILQQGILIFHVGVWLMTSLNTQKWCHWFTVTLQQFPLSVSLLSAMTWRWVRVLTVQVKMLVLFYHWPTQLLYTIHYSGIVNGWTCMEAQITPEPLSLVSGMTVLPAPSSLFSPVFD